jgi:hypothetical protein
MHALYYARTSGFGQRFESVVAGGLSEFCDRLEKPCNEIWLAVQDGRIVGLSDRLPSMGKTWGRVLPTCAGSSSTTACAGAALVADCSARPMAFVDEKDFAETHLWTFVGLSAAQHLYESYGFECVEERPGSQWGREVMEQRFVRCRR